MGSTLTLTAEDGHQLDAYRADPVGEAKGSVVVIQEIFGVNVHIRDVCDRFAAAGYIALAPALFDRLEKGIELDYVPADIERGRDLVTDLGWDDPIKDVRAAALALRPDMKVGVTGYCWGGSVTWLAACRLELAAASVYYGRHIPDFLDEKSRCPIIMHFGEHDASIPLAAVSRIQTENPMVPIHVYPAGHGFNCDRRKDYHAESAALAWSRTLELFGKHLSAA
ncbi:MAG: dienelactone hydrolase family protein [Hyphomicrobiales bacterium]|nr:dienelactone hydrolase family protein [Hyphomicrobiales bacterium]